MISKSSLNYRHLKLVPIYFTIAFIGLVLLAGSLGNLEFEPGLPLPAAGSSNPSLSNPTADSSKLPDKPEFNLVILKIGIGMCFLLLSMMIFFGLMRKTNKRKLGLFILGFIGLIIIFNLLQLFNLDTSIKNDSKNEGVTQFQIIEYEMVPIEEPPTELFWMVGTGLLVGLLSFGVYLFIKADQKTTINNSLIEEINSALQAIQEGKDLGNIILNYYFQLNQIIKEEYDIEREKSLTAREFEKYLSDKGIPITPIHRITSIFEKVRYGNKPTTYEDEQIAIKSLVDIRASCQQNRSSTE